MQKLIRVLDSTVFLAIGASVALSGLLYVFTKSLFRKKRLFIEKKEPVNRLALRIMDLEKEKERTDLEEDILLKGAISKEISAFFDFDSGENSVAKISDRITGYTFGVHRKSGLTKQAI